MSYLVIQLNNSRVSPDLSSFQRPAGIGKFWIFLAVLAHQLFIATLLSIHNPHFVRKGLGPHSSGNLPPRLTRYTTLNFHLCFCYSTETMDVEPPAKRKCMGDDCDKDAGTLQCPTCLKLGMKESYFCSQDCFKRNWASLSFTYYLTKYTVIFAF